MDNDELWCVGCKERINIGEKFIIIVEDYFGDKIKKAYHLDELCLPEMEDDDE